MRRIIFAALATTILGAPLVAPASAADLRAAPVYKAPPAQMSTLYNWTGFYIGGNAGWGWTDGSGNIAINGFPGSFSGSGNGFLGGGQIGYNWQAGQWVFGVETDFQGSTGSGDVNGVAGPTAISATGSTPWFGTIRGRIGYAFDRSLIYFTGGGLYGENKLEGFSTTAGPFSSTADYWTYTLGGGIEQALWDRWTVKLEYLYAGTPDTVALPPGASAVSGSSNSHIVRAGLNYHF